MSGFVVSLRVKGEKCVHSKQMKCLTSKGLKHMRLLYFCCYEYVLCPVSVITGLIIDVNACHVVEYNENRHQNSNGYHKWCSMTLQSSKTGHGCVLDEQIVVIPTTLYFHWLYNRAALSQTQRLFHPVSAWLNLEPIAFEFEMEMLNYAENYNHII